MALQMWTRGCGGVNSGDIDAGHTDFGQTRQRLDYAPVDEPHRQTPLYVRTIQKVRSAHPCAQHGGHEAPGVGTCGAGRGEEKGKPWQTGPDAPTSTPCR
ncbi:hypothetical protein GCM10009602_06530 [Nocardiopsis tropica]